MTSLTGYIQGLGGGEKRTVDKSGKEIKLSVYENIDNLIVFNEAGETSQTTLTGKNLFNLLPYASWVSAGPYILEKNILPENTNLIMSFTDNDTSVDVSGIYFGFCENSYSGGTLTNYNWCLANGNIMANTTNVKEGFQFGAIVLWPTTEETYNKLFARYKIQIEVGSTATAYEPYCGGVPSPNPSYPQDIVGIGFKRPDGTYTVPISYDDGDEHYGTITASGLAYPLYEGDILDFVNGKVIRANGYAKLDQLSWNLESGQTHRFLAYNQITAKPSGSYSTAVNAKCTAYENKTQNNLFAGNLGFAIQAMNGKSIYIYNEDIDDAPSLVTSLNGVYLVYELDSTVDEYITLSGNITDIGTATVTADGTLTVKYDKARMAIEKYSSPPDWSKIGYTSTPNAVIDAFDYAKRIFDTWTFTKYTSDLNLRIFPNVDITGQLGLNAMFKNCTNLISLPPLTIGTDSGTLNASEFARASGIEEVDITSNNLSQENNFQNGFNGCSFLKRYSITAKVSNPSYMFSGCSKLVEAPDFDTSTASAFTEMFSGCSSLTYVSDDFDTSSGTNFYRCFYNCSSLESIPSWDLRVGTNLQQLFAGCSSIKNVPPLVITAATNLTNMFQNSGSNLTELSRNNILMMLATASSYSGTKTLAAVGFTSSMYSAASWQALAKYADFVDAGWSIGYS